MSKSSAVATAEVAATIEESAPIVDAAQPVPETVDVQNDPDTGEDDVASIVDVLKGTYGVLCDRLEGLADDVYAVKSMVGAQDRALAGLDVIRDNSASIGANLVSMALEADARYAAINSKLDRVMALIEAREVRCECRHAPDATRELVAAAAAVAEVGLPELSPTGPPDHTSGPISEAVMRDMAAIHAATYRDAGISDATNVQHLINAAMTQPRAASWLINRIATACNVKPSTVRASMGSALDSGRDVSQYLKPVISRAGGSDALLASVPGLAWLLAVPVKPDGTPGRVSRYYLIVKGIAAADALLSLWDAQKAAS